MTKFYMLIFTVFVLSIGFMGGRFYQEAYAGIAEMAGVPSVRCGLTSDKSMVYVSVGNPWNLNSKDVIWNNYQVWIGLKKVN